MCTSFPDDIAYRFLNFVCLSSCGHTFNKLVIPSKCTDSNFTEGCKIVTFKGLPRYIVMRLGTWNVRHSPIADHLHAYTVLLFSGWFIRFPSGVFHARTVRPGIPPFSYSVI